MKRANNFPKGFLFDLDGVLLDTEPLHSKAWLKSARTIGGELSIQQLKQLKGRRREDCARQILDWIGSSLNTAELLSVHKPISKILLREAKAMPGAEELIKWCDQKKLPMALVTSSSSQSVNFKSKPHKWLELIKTRVHGDDKALLRGKPFPDPFLLASKRLRIPSEDCWAIEDSDAGIKSALAAGCQVLFLNNQPIIHSNLFDSQEWIREVQEISDLKTVILNLKNISN